MTDVHEPVWFWGKARDNSTTVASALGVLCHNLADKIRTGLRVGHSSTHFAGNIAQARQSHSRTLRVHKKTGARRPPSMSIRPLFLSGSPAAAASAPSGFSGAAGR